MDIIIKFNYDEILYNVAIKNGKIIYFYQVNDKKYIDFNREQIKILNDVLFALLPGDEYITLSNYFINGKKHQICVDKKTGFKYLEPDVCIEELIKFNRMFNNESLAVFKSNNLINDKKYINRLVRIGKDIVAVALATSVSLHTFMMLKSPVYAYTVTDGINSIYADNNQTEMSDLELISLITNTLNCNNNITDREKEIILSNKDFFIDNNGYINIDYVKKVLSSLKSMCIVNYNEGISAEYKFLFNNIKYYGVDSVDLVPNEIISHEMLHTFSKYYLDNNKVDTFLTETTNTLFNEEYFNHEQGDYVHYLKYTKALIELLGVEPFRKFQFNNSTSIITDALYEIIPDMNEALRLIYNLNVYMILYNNYLLTNGDDEEIHDNMMEARCELHSEFSKYYMAKYGSNMEDDYVMQCYLDNPAFVKSLEELKAELPEEYRDMPVSITIENKIIYFNNNKKTDENGILLTFYVNKEVKEEVVNEETGDRSIKSSYVPLKVYEKVLYSNSKDLSKGMSR